MYKIFDLHNDYFLRIPKDSKKDNYLSKHETAENIISAVWTSKMNETESFEMLERARNFVNKREKLFLGVEDLHFLSKENLERFVKLKPLYAGLTWNTCNALAGGAHETGRLSTFGKQVVKKLEENHIYVDTAHLNENSFLDVAKQSNKPLFCSHSACYSLCNNPRNLKDYQMKMIVETRGLLGLCLVSDFLNGTKKCLVDDIICHIDYFACKFGIDNLAIGSDFFGTKHLPKGISSYDSLIKKISNGLLKMGYTEKAINKILFDNANNFFKKMAWNWLKIKPLATILIAEVFMNFNESQTKENLARSFAAECQAGARYQFMATMAQSESLAYIKDTMKMIAKNEMAHAKLFYDYIVENAGECKVEFQADYPYVEPTLEKSLCLEMQFEQDEFEKIYPEFAEVARDEGFDDIAESFELVARVEKTHAEMLDLLCQGYKNKSLYSSKAKRLFKCSNCGHFDYLTESWKECPLCSLEKGYIAIDFSEIFEKNKD